MKLSRENSRTLQIAFETYARQTSIVMTSALRTVCELTLLSVEQLTYTEYVETLADATYLTVFSLDPVQQPAVLEIPLPTTMACLDHLLGGPGTEAQPARPLTDLESTVVGGLVERLVSEVRYAFASLVRLEPVVTGVEYSPQLAQVAAASDPMVVARFVLRRGDAEDVVTLCLSFNGLLPFLNASGTAGVVSERSAPSASRPRPASPRASRSRSRSRCGSAAPPPTRPTWSVSRSVTWSGSATPRRPRSTSPPRTSSSPMPPPAAPASAWPASSSRRPPRRTDVPHRQARRPRSRVRAGLRRERRARRAGGRPAAARPRELVAGVVQPAVLVDAAAWAGAAVATLTGTADGTVAVLVGPDLVAALAESPMGPLELGAAVQPALDAAAAALGTTASAGRSLDASEVPAALAAATHSVPLLVGGSTAAVLLLGGTAPQVAPVRTATAAPAGGAGPSRDRAAARRGDGRHRRARPHPAVRARAARADPGDVLELDRAAGSPADLLVNGRLIARGEVVVVDEDFALRITEIVAANAAAS